jgi:hypothetical protein
MVSKYLISTLELDLWELKPYSVDIKYLETIRPSGT